MFAKTTPFLGLLFFVGCFACKSARPFPMDYKGEQIHFGQGGGFTGAVTYYALLDNGMLYQRAPRDSTFAWVDRWDKSFVRQMINNYHALALDSIVCNEPGDKYYFIQHRTKNQPPHRITWGRPGFQPDPKLVNYYHLLYNSTKPGS